MLTNKGLYWFVARRHLLSRHCAAITLLLLLLLLLLPLERQNLLLCDFWRNHSGLKRLSREIDIF
jgi:hypothetical protein